VTLVARVSGAETVDIDVGVGVGVVETLDVMLVVGVVETLDVMLDVGVVETLGACVADVETVDIGVGVGETEAADSIALCENMRVDVEDAREASDERMGVAVPLDIDELFALGYDRGFVIVGETGIHTNVGVGETLEFTPLICDDGDIEIRTIGVIVAV